MCCQLDVSSRSSSHNREQPLRRGELLLFLTRTPEGIPDPPLKGHMPCRYFGMKSIMKRMSFQS